MMQVRHVGLSNETSFGVMEFVNTAKTLGLPKMQTIQNSFSLLVRDRFETDLTEVRYQLSHTRSASMASLHICAVWLNVHLDKCVVCMICCCVDVQIE